jgi:hypothetical protein
MKVWTQRIILMAVLVWAAAAAAVEPEGIDYPRIGRLATRPARGIASSTWSVGGETLDRDFAVYANYRKYLGPLGAKAIRLQGGWAKTEREAGVYHWEWLDEIVDDAIGQGVRPWIETSYGNPIYPGGGGTGLGAGLPRSPQALAAWDAWVKALVGRYKDRVHEWEVWNEPDGARGVTAEAYAEFYLRTAGIIRGEQAKARVYAFGLANSGKTEFVEALLKLAKERGRLGLIDAITIHGYPRNPDDTTGVDRFRELVARYSPSIEIRQGETGAPSDETVGALRGIPWTEVTQAKWDLRRMLAHHGKDVPLNLFTLADLKYAQLTMHGMNRKGLLRCNEDMTVAGPKLAYFAAQRVFGTFDDSLRRVPDVKFSTTSEQRLAVFGYEKKGSGAGVATVWFSGAVPVDVNTTRPVDLMLGGLKLEDPVYVDLLSGGVYEIPADRWFAAPGGGVTFKRLPLYDSPILIAAQSALTIERGP